MAVRVMSELRTTFLSLPFTPSLQEEKMYLPISPGTFGSIASSAAEMKVVAPLTNVPPPVGVSAKSTLAFRVKVTNSSSASSGSWPVPGPCPGSSPNAPPESPPPGLSGAGSQSSSASNLASASISPDFSPVAVLT